MSIHKLFLNLSGKSAYKWAHYLNIYERHLERFVGRAPTVFEIGVDAGGSLDLWHQYFGPGTNVVGLDVNEKCKAHGNENTHIILGSQTDEQTIDNILRTYPPFDIVIDDGSHIMEDMRKTFELVYPRMSPNGVYMVEDTHTCYLGHEKEKWNGGLKAPNSFMELVKDLIDLLHAHWTKGELQWTEFTRTTDSINIYDSMVVFEKRRQAARTCILTASL